MELIKSKNFNENYLAKVVDIQMFRPHSNPTVTKLKCCNIDGYNIITGINEQPGLYIYFPSGCTINPSLLSYASLYRDSTKNADENKKGFFEANGRCKTINLKEEYSEGFLLPAEVFSNWIVDSVNKEIKLVAGTEFDAVSNGTNSFWVNKKYVVPSSGRQGVTNPNSKTTKQKSLKRLNKVIDEQFNFHYSTTLIKKCPFVLNPDQLISITEKVHGTSAISAYVLCRQELNWKQKIAKWLTGEEFNKYDYLWSSRSVIKNKYYNKDVDGGYYDVDLWGIAHKIVQPTLSKGLTVYYEIIGYLPNGGYIQKDYDYGCERPDGTSYIYDKHYKIRVYRVTMTNVDGVVHEYSAKEVTDWCEKVGLVPVTTLYYGYSGHLYPISTTEHWSENFINALANDKKFYMEELSPSCNNKVPHEGVVIRIENSKSAAYKLKCFKFLDKETVNQNNGEVDLEDQA